MEKTRRLRTWGGFLLLLLLLLIFLIWNILAGSVRLPASEIWTILQGGGELSQRRILLQIRLPRLLAALILGGALSVSGYLLQTFFHNPIAGPFVMGVSSGAKLAVALTMVVFLQQGLLTGSATLIIAAFAGSIIAWFRNDEQVVAIGRVALLYACAVMPFMAYSTFVNQLYQCLGFKLPATVLASLRQGICFLPLIFILPHFLGLAGVQATQPASDLLTFFICIPFQIAFFRKHLQDSV